MWGPPVLARNARVRCGQSSRGHGKGVSESSGNLSALRASLSRRGKEVGRKGRWGGGRKVRVMGMTVKVLPGIMVARFTFRGQLNAIKFYRGVNACPRSVARRSWLSPATPFGSGGGIGHRRLL